VLEIPDRSIKTPKYREEQPRWKSLSSILWRIPLADPWQHLCASRWKNSQMWSRVVTPTSRWGGPSWIWWQLTRQSRSPCPAF